MNFFIRNWWTFAPVSSIEYRVSSLMVVWKRYRLWKEVSSAPTLRPQKNAAKEYKVKRCSTKSQWSDENEQTSPRHPLYQAGSEYHDFGKTPQTSESAGIKDSTNFKFLKRNSHFACWKNAGSKMACTRMPGLLEKFNDRNCINLHRPWNQGPPETKGFFL